MSFHAPAGGQIKSRVETVGCFEEMAGLGDQLPVAHGLRCMDARDVMPHRTIVVAQIGDKLVLRGGRSDHQDQSRGLQNFRYLPEKLRVSL